MPWQDNCPANDTARLWPERLVSKLLTASVRSKSPSQSAQGQGNRKKAGAEGKSVRSCDEGCADGARGLLKTSWIRSCSISGDSSRSGTARMCSLISCSRLGRSFECFRVPTLTTIRTRLHGPRRASAVRHESALPADDTQPGFREGVTQRWEPCDLTAGHLTSQGSCVARRSG
jgi:hypothetical protein